MEPVNRTRTTPLPVRPDDAFVGNTSKGGNALINRIQNDRALAIRLLAIIVVVVLAGAAIAITYNMRANAASAALADAMQVLDAPVSTPDQPVPPGTRSFSSTTDRARAAAAQFQPIAEKYGMTPAGRNALYLQAVSTLEAGDKAAAEPLLKKSSDSSNGDVATLSEMALAGLYHATGRDAQAIDTYKKIADHPSTLVPAGLARLNLAALYQSQGKTDAAKKLYAEIKDKDPKSAAAEIASEKLGGAPTR